MSLLLTEEQEAIRKSARDLLRARAPMSVVRALREPSHPDGYARELWAEMGELGIAGLSIAAEDGGSGGSLADVAVVMEELGRTLAPMPLLSTVSCAAVIERLGDAAQRAMLLGPVAAGTSVLAFAHEEGRHHAPTRIATSLRARGDDLVLRGEKSFVPDGHGASAYVVVARSDGEVTAPGGLSVVVVPASAPGLVATRLHVVDGRNVARVRFDDVVVPRAGVLGPLGGAADALERARDRAAVALSAEMLGGALEAFERTVAYLKERRQFGVPIGSFQALKHRAATMFCELELFRSIVLEASRALDAGREDAPRLASVAKARASDVFVHVANEAIQMHGGIGVTDEHDIGLFLKRARVAELSFGDAAYHRDRFATLSGY